jgi:hypothetical protein
MVEPIDFNSVEGLRDVIRKILTSGRRVTKLAESTNKTRAERAKLR